ncbi:MAG: FixH family protein [Pseudomonadota bacterium]
MSDGIRDESAQTGFQITGPRVFAALAAFFAVIIVVNVIFVTLAVRSHPGEQEAKSYRQGVDYNRRLEARAAQTALGWRARIDAADLEGDEVAIVLSFFEKGGVGETAPRLYDLDITGVLMRPATAAHDTPLVFTPTSDGAYQARAALAATAEGVWRLSATAVNAADDRFTFEMDIELQ